MQDEDRVRQRAHEIWEREGRPEGRHEAHWAQACREVAAEDADARRGSASASAAPDDSPTVEAPDHAGVAPGEAAAAADAVGTPRRAETGQGNEAGAAEAERQWRRQRGANRSP